MPQAARERMMYDASRQMMRLRHDERFAHDVRPLREPPTLTLFASGNPLQTGRMNLGVAHREPPKTRRARFRGTPVPPLQPPSPLNPSQAIKDLLGSRCGAPSILSRKGERKGVWGIGGRGSPSAAFCDARTDEQRHLLFFPQILNVQTGCIKKPRGGSSR